MALYKNFPYNDERVEVVNSAAGTPAGNSWPITPSHVRGRLMRVGVAFNHSAVSSNATLGVVVWGANGSTSAMTSTAFGSVPVQGKASEMDIPSPVFVEEGDGIQLVTSGGPTSAFSSVGFAIIRP